jgi:hypothetical protein
MTGSQADMTKEDAETAKARAEAAKAEAEAKRAERELDEWNNALSQRRKEEGSDGAITNSQQASTAQPFQFSQLIPDLSKASTGETKVTGDQAIQGSALALRALEKAAGEVADVIISAAKGPDCTLLVTSELDLVTSDALFLEVQVGLQELEAAAAALLQPEEAAAPSPFEVLPAFGVVAALSAAIPSALSLLAANRVVTTHTISPDDTAAAIAVSGALANRGAIVIHDQFRVLVKGEIHASLERVRSSRQGLMQKNLELERVTDDDPDRRPRVDLISSLITAIDAYLSAISSNSSTGQRSALTNAVLREVLHGPGANRRFAVLIKGCGGSSEQLVNDRPFLFKDEFSIVASMGISYLLVNAGNGRIAAGGSRSGSVMAAGKIGRSLEFKASV